MNFLTKSFLYSEEMFLPVYILTLVASVAAQATTAKWFDHYILVMLENQDIATVLSNDDFKKVASSGILHTNYHGVTHPSQPNCKLILG